MISQNPPFSAKLPNPMPTERSLKNSLSAVLDIQNPTPEQLKAKQEELLKFQKELEEQRKALEVKQKTGSKSSASTSRLRIQGQRGQGLQVVE